MRIRCRGSHATLDTLFLALRIAETAEVGLVLRRVHGLTPLKGTGSTRSLLCTMGEVDVDHTYLASEELTCV